MSVADILAYITVTVSLITAIVALLQVRGSATRLELDALKCLINELQEDNTRLRSSVEELQKENKRLATFVTKLQADNERLAAANHELEVEVGKLSTALKTEQGNTATLRNRLDELVKENAKLHKYIGELAGRSG